MNSKWRSKLAFPIPFRFIFVFFSFWISLSLSVSLSLLSTNQQKYQCCDFSLFIRSFVRLIMLSPKTNANTHTHTHIHIISAVKWKINKVKISAPYHDINSTMTTHTYVHAHMMIGIIQYGAYSAIYVRWIHWNLSGMKKGRNSEIFMYTQREREKHTSTAQKYLSLVPATIHIANVEIDQHFKIFNTCMCAIRVGQHYLFIRFNVDFRYIRCQKI